MSTKSVYSVYKICKATEATGGGYTAKTAEEATCRASYSLRMRGIDSSTGKPLEGLAHLRQSIRDILTTPIGSRVMRREYGSRLFELVDSPANEANRIEYIAATAEALDRWEPRLRVTRVQVSATDAGKVLVALDGVYLPDGREITMDGLQI